jgi:hypothetical protein
MPQANAEMPLSIAIGSPFIAIEKAKNIFKQQQTIQSLPRPLQFFQRLIPIEY